MIKQNILDIWLSVSVTFFPNDYLNFEGFFGASEASAPLVESSQDERRRGGGDKGRIPVLTSFLEP